MSTISIQCRLVAKEETRHYLWHLMAEKYTGLINELLQQVARHPSFEEWCYQDKIPLDVVKQLCNELKQNPQFAAQPGRFYTSAIALVHRTFKSWLALRQRLRNQIAGQTRWLAILKSDEELIKESQSDVESLKQKANELLNQISGSVGLQENTAKPKKTRSKKDGKKTAKSQGQSTASKLFSDYEKTDDVLTRCAIAYLLKNGCKVPEKAETPEKFAKRYRKVEIRFARLTNTLLYSRLPKGRDLSSSLWLQTLANATESMPSDENEAANWQAILLSEKSTLPFPVNFETNEDLNWSLHIPYQIKPNFWLRAALFPQVSSGQKLNFIKFMFLNEILSTRARICVSFNGLSEHVFEIYCDQRQLHWFDRFLEDQLVKKLSGDQHSAGLFSLRSGRISWQEGKRKGDPWNIHHLTLTCSVETDSWTQEGTEKIRQQKASECAKILTSTKAKPNLNKKQEDFIKRREKMLTLLNSPFPRPSRSFYQGQPSIIAGISYGLDKPATLAIINIQTGKVITYRSIRQLLGPNYKLLNRYRLRQQRKAHKRHDNQRKGASKHLKTKDRNLGIHIDRLIARAIITTAQQYQASCLVLPDLGNIREVVQSEVLATAEQRIVGDVERQRQYALKYRASVHRWSYARLSQNLQSQASQVGIAVEIVKQSYKGTPQEKARDLAIAAYQSRK